jgi:hypothetical protein
MATAATNNEEALKIDNSFSGSSGNAVDSTVTKEQHQQQPVLIGAEKDAGSVRKSNGTGTRSVRTKGDKDTFFGFSFLIGSGPYYYLPMGWLHYLLESSADWWSVLVRQRTCFEKNKYSQQAQIKFEDIASIFLTPYLLNHFILLKLYV